MKATLTVKMDNEAFTELDHPMMELARILRELSEQLYTLGGLDRLGNKLNVRDINGNKVGSLIITND